MGDVVNAPLPEPVEDVVQSSPVAPVRDEVRRVGRQATGGSGGGGPGGGGSSTGGSGSATGGGTGNRGNTGAGHPGARNGRSGSGRGDGSRGRQGAALRRAAATTPGRGSATTPGARGRSGGRARTGTGTRDERSRSAAIRTIETVVAAVPTIIWIALGVLSLLAIGLAGRTHVERRRARSLAADREHLLGDVAALERALLPAIPERVGGVAISVAYRSSDGPAAGGDFYDAFELPGGRAAVIVGDISGHGPDALEGTNSVRAQLHALLETGMTPRAAIAMVGERSPVQLAGRFSTVVVAIHDPVGRHADARDRRASSACPRRRRCRGAAERGRFAADRRRAAHRAEGDHRRPAARLHLLLLHGRHRRGEERRGDDRPREAGRSSSPSSTPAIRPTCCSSACSPRRRCRGRHDDLPPPPRVGPGGRGRRASRCWSSTPTRSTATSWRASSRSVECRRSTGRRSSRRARR